MLAAGVPLGPYRILAPLGAGGMGEVYRAHDSRLGRDVAIKVLPQHVAATPDIRARFEREARTISQLNHPHICTLHDIGHEGDTAYLVMELVEGETLAQRLARGPLPPGDVLKFGAQIADALDRAHRAGVVHRDLKPGNVMLTRTGAKLMDFGLARTTAIGGPVSSASLVPTMAQSPASTPLTAEGAMVGTFQYMAPEQLEGREADVRSDLWALGCVLYEMATGVRAFAGESQASLIAAIMTAVPRPIVQLRPLTPAGLDRVVSQCLHKDPEARLQSAHDVAFMLGLIASGELGASPPIGDTATRASTRHRTRWLVAAAVLVIAAASYVGGRITTPRSGQGSIRVSTLSQGTRDNEPAVSPDGRLIAFSAVRQNGQGLWLMDMITRSELKLTSADDHLPRFTSDGGSILFTRNENARQSLWRIPVIGGVPRRIMDGSADADPSPDGSQIAYIAGTQDSAGVRARLMVAKSDRSEDRELWSKGSVAVSSPRWSPDGARIAIVISANQNATNRIAIVDVKTGSAREFPAPNGAVLSTPAWDGSGNGIVVAEGVGITAIQRGASARLHRLDVRSGRYRPLGWLENFPVTIDLLPDGRLVLSSLRVRQNLREVALDALNLIDGRWLTSGMSMDRQPVYSPDGKAILFSSNRGGTLDLWEASVETGEMHRVTDDPADDWDPEYAPDGQSIFWCSSRSGAFEIWTARRDGSAPRQLSRDSLDAENPSVSPDNQWVLYSSAHPRKSGLWRIPVTGGVGEWLLRAGTLIPDLSPDGRHLSMITDVGTTGAKLSVIELPEAKPLAAPVPLQVVPGTIQTGRSRFMPDGSAVAYLYGRDDGHIMMLRRPLSAWRTGAGRIDTLFARTTETIESFGFSPDGRRAAVSVVDWLSGLSISEAVPGIVRPKRTAH